MNARCRSIRLGALATAVLLLGCSEARRYDQAICALVDVSGTYADQKAEVAKILKRDVLLGMVPGDTLIVIQIDSESYERENLVALMTLDQRPSRANAQKLALARKLDRFASSEAGSKYTDIPGAIMLASEYPELGITSPLSLDTRYSQLYVIVDDVDSHYQRAREAGAVILSELQEEHGDRFYRANDPEGHRWIFAQPLAD